MELTIPQRIDLNNRYQAKIAYKQKEGLNLKQQIYVFIQENFDISLPFSKKEFKHTANHNVNEKWQYLLENYMPVINLYYTLGYNQDAIASLFKKGKDIALWLHGALFTKHRLDPVWNYRKSGLIRAKYASYLHETQIYKCFFPVHLVLTLPHKNGKYKGNRFYANELISKFNKIRKLDKWKEFIYAGEYGVEVSNSSNNGLHIHIHSLCFLYSKDIQPFRKWLQKAWEQETGATQIWVEGLYINKKDDTGKYITELKPKNKVESFEYNEYGIEEAEQNFICIRKKFYISDEVANIEQDNVLTIDEKETLIRGIYLTSILECIKYHFKHDSLKLDKDTYDIFLINEVLTNTKGKRLYSRFGAFYNEKKLAFNNIEKEDNSDLDEEINGTMKGETSVNPFTGEEIPTEETEIVIYQPNKLKYFGLHSATPYELKEYNTKDFEIQELARGQTVRDIMRNLIIAQFKPKKKIVNHV